MSSRDETITAFVQLLTESQPALLAYSAKLVGDPEEARNVLQEANLTIWKKLCEFRPGTCFLAWARRIVYFQVLAQLRDNKRRRLVFDENVVRKLATIEPAGDEDERRLALRDCLAGLLDRHRSMIMDRYYRQQTIQSIAEHSGKTPNAICNMLMRIRQSLMRCIEERTMAQ